MRSYAPAVETLQWQTLTPQHMPPIGEDFLLWVGTNEKGGGFFTVAQRVNFMDMDKNGSIIKIEVIHGHILPLFPQMYKNCRWAAIAPPKCVIRKRIKEKQKRMELMERYENQT